MAEYKALLRKSKHRLKEIIKIRIEIKCGANVDGFNSIGISPSKRLVNTVMYVCVP